MQVYRFHPAVFPGHFIFMNVVNNPNDSVFGTVCLFKECLKIMNPAYDDVIIEVKSTPGLELQVSWAHTNHMFGAGAQNMVNRTWRYVTASGLATLVHCVYKP